MSFDVIGKFLNMFKNLEKLVLTDCFFIEGLNKDAHFKKQGQFYNFSMKPYVPNTIKKLELRDCGIDTAHFKQIANLCPEPGKRPGYSARHDKDDGDKEALENPKKCSN